jgi:nicotinic acid mononucleotide adenylyltransferase
MIRRYLKEGLSCRHLIPEQVREYILRERALQEYTVDSMGNRKVYSHEPEKDAEGKSSWYPFPLL